MKSFTKVFLIISGIFMAIGLALVITGGAMGGAKVIAKDLDNGILNISWGTDFLMTDDDFKNMTSISEKQHFSKEEVSRLEFSGKYGEFEIVTWDKDYYEIQGDETSENVGYSFNEGVLKVATTGSNHWIFKQKGVKVKIYIPQDAVLNKAVLNVGAGTLTCKQIKAEQLESKIGAGEAVFEGIEAKKAKFEVGAGEGTITDVTIEECDMKVGMGEFDVQGSIEGNVNIDCGMGEVNCELTNGYKSFNYNVKVGAGEVEIGNEEYSGLSKKVEVDNGAEKTMNIDCGMGDVSVEFHE